MHSHANGIIHEDVDERYAVRFIYLNTLFLSRKQNIAKAHVFTKLNENIFICNRLMQVNFNTDLQNTNSELKETRPTRRRAVRAAQICRGRPLPAHFYKSITKENV